MVDLKINDKIRAILTYKIYSIENVLIMKIKPVSQGKFIK